MRNLPQIASKSAMDFSKGSGGSDPSQEPRDSERAGQRLFYANRMSVCLCF